MRFSNTKNRWKTTQGHLRYKKWRKSVFELNYRKYGLSKNYICVKCDKKRKTTRVLHAHHIYSWHKFPQKRYTIKNGVVLCNWCHSKFHKKYGYKSVQDPTLLLEYLKNDKNVSNYIESINS